MDFTSQICTTKEQSERLLAMGLRRETADMCWTIRADDREGNEYSVEYMSIGQGEYQMMHPNWYIPAWSLHRLIELSGMGIIYSSTDNIYDKVIQYIEYIIKCGDFNKEHLN